MIVYKVLTCFSCFILNIGGCWGMGTVRLVVDPPVVYRGGSATLRCERDLQGAPLYAVKWYRGNYEFYRYSPAENPKTKVFPLPRIYVDAHQSNETQVVLWKLELSLTGNFSCEVTADAPSFSTQVVSKFINIYALPEGVPTLQAQRRSYSPGDVLRANCTAPAARPAANLTMLLNEETTMCWKFTNTMLEGSGRSFSIQTTHKETRPQRSIYDYDRKSTFKLLVTSSETRLFQNDTGLQWSDINMLVHLTPAHFIFGRLRLICVASLNNLYLEKSNLEFFSPDADPRPERITSSSTASLLNLNFSVRLLMMTLLLFMMFFKRANGFDQFYESGLFEEDGLDFSLYDSSQYDEDTMNSLIGA